MTILNRSYFCRYCIAFIAINLLFTSAPANAGCEDFEIEGTYEMSFLPEIWFLLKYAPNEPPIEVEGNFELNYAYLDTGASGILLSKETTELMQIAVDANAQFVDTGVGGDEYFDVSVPLYIGIADYAVPDPYDPDIYSLYGPWRFQVSQEYAVLSAMDVLGIPLMAGRTVVLRPIKDFDFDLEDEEWDLPIYYAGIKDPNDPNIPQADFQVALRFEKYINPSNPQNIPPLPVLAYNPVIDDIVVEHNGISFKGDWLFDTGAMASIISIDQAVALGLTDANGEPMVEVDFWAIMGGIGGGVEIPGFIVDKLSVPTLAGFNLVYIDARVCVHNISVLDEDSGQFITLDGVFGENFLSASITSDFNEAGSTPFDYIVIDTQNALLGFDVNSVYPLPVCRFTDLSNDCRVNTDDLAILSQYWLRADCNSNNDFCDGADIDEDGSVNFNDFAFLADDWLKNECQYPCGSEKRPFSDADLTRDCIIDIYDLEIIAEEWLNSCDWLNWNCRGGDMDKDGILNFEDFAAFAENW